MLMCLGVPSTSTCSNVLLVRRHVLGLDSTTLGLSFLDASSASMCRSVVALLISRPVLVLLVRQIWKGSSAGVHPTADWQIRPAAF